MEESSHIKSFVMRRGNITLGQQRALSQLGDRYIIPYSTQAARFSDYKKSDDGQVVLEIGFGMGDATALIAEANPQNLYLGIEVYNAGVGRLLMHIEKKKLDNIRIIEHDAVEVLDTMIPAASLDGVHIFFPDPWPKKRHHKRRLLQSSFIKNVAEHLKKEGYLYAVTDWADYAEEILKNLSAEALLKNRYEGYAEPQSWRPETKFEAKGKMKEHAIFEFFFVKK